MSAHSLLGKKAGLSAAAVADACRGAGDPLVAFARAVLDCRGKVSDADVEAVRAAGYGDAEIAEAVAHVALNVLTNLLNNVARTPIDFPKVEPPAGHVARTAVR